MPRLVIILGLVLCGSFASADTHRPKVSIVEARKTALARVPGKVVHEKIKHKKEGHDLYYFKIHPRDQASNDTLKKVEVDTETGMIVKIKDVKAKSKSED